MFVKRKGSAAPAESVLFYRTRASNNVGKIGAIPFINTHLQALLPNYVLLTSRHQDVVGGFLLELFVVDSVGQQ